MKKYLILPLIGLFMLVSAGSLQPRVAAATPAPTIYPPFPTATVYATPTNKGDVYKNDESGFSISIPKGVTATTPNADSGAFQEYELGRGEVFGRLYPTSVQTGETLEQVGKQARDYQAEGLDKINYLTDKEITLPNGSKAWYSQFQGYVSQYKYTVEVRVTTVINVGQAVTLMFYSLPENFASWENTIAGMRDSIQLSAPSVMGFPRDEVLILESGENKNPRENDPATTHGSGDNMVFSGLVTYNDKLEIMPDLAESWEINPEGTVYTFHLEPSAVFHNGKPFTAQDVVYSWERATNPATNSDTVVTYLGDIVGLKEMRDGKAETISGLKIIDDHTLQVTIDEPKPYFLFKLTYPTGYIVDKENVESGTEWFRTPNGTGPYRLMRWDSMEKMIYQRFEEYYSSKPAIPNVVFSLYTGVGIRLYESGAIDSTGIGSYDVQRVSDPTDPLNKELITGANLCTSYVIFDVTKPPFDDVKVRQAFSMAFDKDKYIEVVLNNSVLPAKGLYPPALPGYNLDLKGLDYDPVKARQLLKESKYGTAEALPEIIYTDSGYSSYVSADVSALIQMWQQNLGVTITVQNLEPEKSQDEIHNGNHGQIISSGWCADYPDPENFADILFHSGTEMNEGNYSNPELDKMLEKARVEKDVTKRMDLYQQAEQIIVNDAPALFLSHSMSYVLVKPYLKGYILSPVSTFPLVRYLWIDGSYWK